MKEKTIHHLYIEYWCRKKKVKKDVFDALNINVQKNKK